MASTHSFQMPVTLNQILHLVKQLPKDQKSKLMRFLKKEAETEDVEVPEWHKEIVRKRMATSKPEDFTSWKKAKKLLKHK